MTRRSRNCPRCGQTGIPIVHGLPPDHPIGVAAEEGLISLGGCVIDDDYATWTCLSCQFDWEGPDPDRAMVRSDRFGKWDRL